MRYSHAAIFAFYSKHTSKAVVILIIDLVIIVIVFRRMYTCIMHVHAFVNTLYCNIHYYTSLQLPMLNLRMYIPGHFDVLPRTYHFTMVFRWFNSLCCPHE